MVLGSPVGFRILLVMEILRRMIHQMFRTEENV
jgi:hypothetical protein